MGRVFNGLVRLLLVPGVHDTQCGFKLFRAEVARALLRSSRLYRDGGQIISGPRVTAFDVELLTIARLNGYRICPVPVVWSYGEGSKVRPLGILGTMSVMCSTFGSPRKEVGIVMKLES